MSAERVVRPISGWLALPLVLLMYVAGAGLLWWSFAEGEATADGGYKGTVRRPGLAWGNPFYANGSSTQQTATPSGRRGKGESEVRSPPHPKRYKVSLRARTHNGERLKVNDMRGNPVEIAAVVV